MRLPLPEPCRDPEIFQPMFEKGMREYPRRRENYELARTSPRMALAAAMPTMMDIEPTSRCNYRCPMCARSTWSQQTRADDMSLETFRSILDNQYGLHEIKIQGLGEPLLNADLCDMVALCSERSIWTRTTVNGSLLHVNDNARRLLEAGIGEVQISFDGATREVFESIRRGSNFELFTENCRLINRLAAPMRATSAVRAFMLVQKENVRQLEDTLSLIASLGFRRMVYSLDIGWFGDEKLKDANQQRTVGGGIELDRYRNLIELGDRLGVDVTFWQGGNKYRRGRPESLCGWLWGRAYIGSDGQVVPCCTICDPRVLCMGRTNDFAEIWNGDAYREFRQRHLSGRIPDICAYCYDKE